MATARVVLRRSSYLAVAVSALLAIGCTSYEIDGLSEIAEVSLEGIEPVLVLVATDRAPGEWPLSRRRDAAAKLATALVRAGFATRVVSDPASIPAEALWVEDRLLFQPRAVCVTADLNRYTFGIFPAFCDREFGHVLVLHRGSRPALVEIDTRYRIPIAIGWLAVPLNLLPGRSARLPDALGTEREGRALRKALADVLAE